MSHTLPLQQRLDVEDLWRNLYRRVRDAVPERTRDYMNSGGAPFHPDLVPSFRQLAQAIVAKTQQEEVDRIAADNALPMLRADVDLYRRYLEDEERQEQAAEMGRSYRSKVPADTAERIYGLWTDDYRALVDSLYTSQRAGLPVPTSVQPTKKRRAYAFQLQGWSVLHHRALVPDEWGPTRRMWGLMAKLPPFGQVLPLAFVVTRDRDFGWYVVRQDGSATPYRGAPTLAEAQQAAERALKAEQAGLPVPL